MAVFNNACLTLAGLALEAQAAAGTAKIGISSMVVGTGVHTDTSTETLEAMTALLNQNSDVVVTLNGVSQFSAKQVNVKGTVSNVNLLVPITVTEVGIYAYDTLTNSTPILYAVAVTTNGDILPEYNGSVPSYIIEQMLIAVGNASNVSIMVPVITDADNIAYDNSESGMDAENVQDAVDELSVNVEELKTLIIEIPSISSLPVTVNDDRIRADHVVDRHVLTDPSAKTGDWTVTTVAGSLTVSGTIDGTTGLTLYMNLSQTSLIEVEEEEEEEEEP